MEVAILVVLIFILIELIAIENKLKQEGKD